MEYPSIQIISENVPSNTEEFSFRPVLDSEVKKILSKIDPKESTESLIYLQRLLNRTSSIHGTVVILLI